MKAEIINSLHDVHWLDDSRFTFVCDRHGARRGWRLGALNTIVLGCPCKESDLTPQVMAHDDTPASEPSSEGFGGDEKHGGDDPPVVHELGDGDDDQHPVAPQHAPPTVANPDLGGGKRAIPPHPHQKEPPPAAPAPAAPKDSPSPSPLPEGSAEDGGSALEADATSARLESDPQPSSSAHDTADASRSSDTHDDSEQAQSDQEPRAERRRQERARAKQLYATALWYAREKRWFVLPVWWIENGRCACGRADCDSPGKHPLGDLVPRGCLDASVYAQTITRWWQRFPKANIGCAMAPSGLVAPDIDPRHGGDESALIERIGRASLDTVRNLTPTGGLHPIFTVPKGSPELTIYTGKPTAGIDIRAGAAGYILLPPSNHLLGEYHFEVGHSPRDLDPLPAPAALIELARRRDQGAVGHSAGDAADEMTGFDILRALSGVPEGERDDQVFRAACSFRACNTAKRVTLKLILDAAKKCDPPFPEKAAREKVNRVYKRYPAGQHNGGSSSEGSSAPPPSGPAGAGDEKKPKLAAADSMGLARAWSKRHVERQDGRTLHRWDGGFWRWDGGRYELISDEDIRASLWGFLKNDVLLTKGEEDLLAPTSRTVSEALDALKAHVNLPSLSHRPPCWIGEPPLSIDASAIVPAANGLLHVPTGELFDPTPRWFCFAVLKADYVPSADCPEWRRFLEQLWPDQQSRDTLQEIFGYLLTADMSQQKAFIIVGPPRSGKGTIGRIVAALLGPDAVGRPALADFAYQFGIEPLIGKSLAIVSDARLDNATSAGLLAERLLAISGEDSINVSRKFRPTWNGQLQIRFLILANELPRFTDASGALPHRFIVLKTAKSFLGKEDLTLFARLAAELPGILNWALEGWMRLQERGYFIQPDSAKEMAEHLASIANPLGPFIEEACELGPDKTTTIGSLYRQYVDWSKDLGMKASPATIFGRDLRAAEPGLRFYRVGSGPRSIEGIAPSQAWRDKFSERERTRASERKGQMGFDV